MFKVNRRLILNWIVIYFPGGYFWQKSTSLIFSENIGRLTNLCKRHQYLPDRLHKLDVANNQLLNFQQRWQQIK